MMKSNPKEKNKEFDAADFSNTNIDNKSLAEIRREAFTAGYLKGKADEREEITNIIKKMDRQFAELLAEILKNINAGEKTKEQE